MIDCCKGKLRNELERRINNLNCSNRRKKEGKSVWNDISDVDKKKILTLAMQQANSNMREAKKECERLEKAGKKVAWNFEPEYYRAAEGTQYYMAKLIEQIENNLVEIEQNIINNLPSKEEQIKEIEAMISSMRKEQESALPYKVNITMQHGKVQKVDKKIENKKMEIGLFEDMIKKLKEFSDD